MKNLLHLGTFLAGVFTWMLAVFLGAVLLDIVYSHLLKDGLGFLAGNAVFSEAADLLLILEAFTILFGIAAIVFSWNIGPARNLFLASFLLLVGFEFLLPIFLFPLLQGIPDSFLQGLGPIIRLLPTALASCLAFAGFHKMSRRVLAFSSTMQPEE